MKEGNMKRQRPTSEILRAAAPWTEAPEQYMSIAAKIEAYDRPISVAELSKLIRLGKSTIYEKARACPPRIPCMRFDDCVQFDPKLTAAWYRAQYRF